MPIFSPLQIERLVDFAKKGRIAPVYLFLGPIPMIEEKAKRIYEVLLSQGSLLEVHDLRSLEGKKGFSQAKGYQEGLFGLRKVYVVIGAEEITPFKAEEIVTNLSRYEIPPFCCFLLSENFPENHPLYQYSQAKGAIISFPSRRKEELLEIELDLELKKYGSTMSKEVANLFLSLVSEDYHHFKNELQKLLLYVGDREISEDDVLQVVVPFQSSALYLMVDTLLKGELKGCLSIIESLIDLKTDPHHIIIYLYRHFKKLELFQEILQNNLELSKQDHYSLFIKRWQEMKRNPALNLPSLLAEIHPYALFKMKDQLRRIKSFIPFYTALFQAELDLKKDFKGPEEVFPKLILEIWQALNE